MLTKIGSDPISLQDSLIIDISETKEKMSQIFLHGDYYQKKIATKSANAGSVWPGVPSHGQIWLNLSMGWLWLVWGWYGHVDNSEWRINQILKMQKCFFPERIGQIFKLLTKRDNISKGSGCPVIVFLFTFIIRIVVDLYQSYYLIMFSCSINFFCSTLSSFLLVPFHPLPFHPVIFTFF